MKHRTIIGLAITGLLSLPSWAAEEPVDAAIEAGTERTEEARQAQGQIDSLAEQIDQRVEQYRAVEKEIEGLEVYVAQLEAQIADQESELGILDRSIENVTLVERQITPLMLRMIDALEQFVELDVPFLKAQRAQRVQRLQDMIGRADVTVAEKFRNVMEAYQTEIEYGQTIEAYRGPVAIDGAEQEVDFLRIGRLALVYLSLDGERAGIWDQGSGSWELLDAGYRSQIEQGLRIAREQTAPDLIRIPVKNPEAP